jgi:glycosyltransferase involved in cell wall biosynthesis
MPKILLVSRCAWTLYNFRRGQMCALQADGATVIGAGAGGDGFESRIEALGIPFVSLPVDKRALNPLADLKLLWRLYRWYRQERPDIVHHFTIKPVIYGSIAARLAGVPRTVNTVTGLGFVFSEGAKPWLRRLVEAQYRVALARVHYTFFQNHEDRDLFLKQGLVAPDKTGLLPGSGVDTQHFLPPTAGVQAETVTFLMVARLLKDKGVYEFVEAARLVRAQAPNTRFQLLGGRDERNPRVVPKEHLDQWQQEGVVEWLGETSDVRGAMGSADAVVLPSFYREGTPRSLLEAAAMGRAIITTDSVGCREAVEDGVTGLLIPIKDSNALAAAMLRLASDPQVRNAMGEAGRAKMLREFDERLVIQKIKQVYAKEQV